MTSAPTSPHDAVGHTSRAKPHVVVYSEFQPNRLGSSYARAFEASGCRVTRFDVRDAQEFGLGLWLKHRVGHRATQGSLRLRRLGSRGWNRRVLEATAPADLVFIIRGDFLMPETLRAIRERGPAVFIFHPDSPLPPSSNSRPEHLASARASTCYFVWSRDIASRLRSMGVQRVEYLPFAWDPDVFPHTGLAPKPQYNVAFVGGWDRHREALLEPIASRFDLRIWGPEYWATRTRSGSPLRACWQGRAAVGREVSGIVSLAAVTLNVLREQNLPDGTNMRTFEVPGIGGFSLSTRTTGACEIFAEGRAGIYFATPEECVEQIERCLRDASLRQRVAQEAHSIVAQCHRYTDRVGRILEVFYECNRLRLR